MSQYIHCRGVFLVVNIHNISTPFSKGTFIFACIDFVSCFYYIWTVNSRRRLLLVCGEDGAMKESFWGRASEKVDV